MEPEVHIVERYLQLVKHWFTMTNLMLDGGKEVDLLAFDPHSGEKYRIEVRVATGRGFRIKLLDTQTHDGRKHKRGMDTLNEIKFSPSKVSMPATRFSAVMNTRKSSSFGMSKKPA